MRQSAMIPILCALASLRLTLGGLVVLALGLVADQNQWLADPRFRRKPALLAFHLCLLLLALLAGYGQLARYDARLLLAEGQEFAGDLLEPVRSGPLAPTPLADGTLRQGAIAVDYTPGLRRGATRSQVWVAGRGWLEVGDDVPLLVDGYRLYTTSNKGFAALFSWLPEHGEPLLGAVHFPSYPVTELGQVSRWRTPAGQELGMALALPPSPYNETWTLTTAQAQGVAIKLTVDGQSQALHPGEIVPLAGGRLRYERVGMWMGYQVTHDPTLPWLFSLAVLAVIFMAVHFAGRVWRPERTDAVAGSRYPA